MDFQNILYETKDNIAIVTINRPEKLNALNIKTMQEIKSVFEKIKEDESIYVVLVTGAGDKAFVAGADITELNELNIISGKEFSEAGQEVFSMIENSEKPVIAVVNGYALGGGCELALACHMRLASENAKFGQPEVNLGVIPGYGGTQRLTRLINSGRAMQHILTGDAISAEEALKIGLANKVYPHEELMEKAFEMAKKIASKAQVAVRMAVKSVVACDELSETEGQKLEASLFAACCGSEDFKEGTSAFLEKRKPEFKNK